MSAPRTDVASSIKVGDLFTFEPLSFDAIAANDYMDKCTTCIESEELCDVLEEILVTLDDPDMPNTPERLRLVNSVQWTALKCSRKSIRLQNKKFKDYIRDIERLNRVPTAASPTSQPKRKTAKRQPASPSKQTPLKKQAKSGESSHPLPPPLAILKALSLLWRKGKLQPKRARMRFQQSQLSRTLKTTNWIKFQEIISHTIPGNPRIDDLDLAVQNFTSNISNAISASTSTRLITTPHLRLPENIRELIRAKNRFRKLWNETRYPPYKREVNALIRQIRKEIQEHKNRTWKDFLLTLNPEDNSLYNLHRKFSKRHIPLPPLHGPGGMAYSDFEKAEVFKDTLEVTFQENEEPYCDDKIEEVESLVDDFFDNFTTCTPPLTSPSEVRGIIKKLQNRKAAGPDQIPNIAFKYFTQNVLTHLTKLYNQCLIKNHFPTLWKQANVIMLAKPNQDRSYPQGYRPISLINATAKIFERIILTRIKSHCKAIDCIPRSNAASGRAIQRYTN
ncbi:probable RNA-directed DNA polymerase from transposon X-element [Trichonephila clavipes]|nr:probable RNA-directed DNA polymerase from transposon X-element [Trichonephila clavipes]